MSIKICTLICCGDLCNLYILAIDLAMYKQVTNQSNSNLTMQQFRSCNVNCDTYEVVQLTYPSRSSTSPNRYEAILITALISQNDLHTK